MKNPKLDVESVARWLQNLSDYELVEFFNTHLAARHIYSAEQRYLQSHLVLANAVKAKDEPNWRLQVLCATPNEKWADDSPICQFGTHCGYTTASVGKHSICAICGGDATGS